MTGSTPPSILTGHHLALKVRQLEPALAFYHGVLGLPIIRRWEDGAGAPRSIWLQAGELILMLERSDTARLEEAVSPVPPRFADDPPGWHLAALRVPANARGAWLEHFARHAVPVVHQSAFSIYVQDPEGNRVALSHYPDPA